MMGTHAALGIIGLIVCSMEAAAVAPVHSPLPAADGCKEQNSELAPPIQVETSQLDARAFFDRLVSRYKGLRVYRDIARIVQVTRHLGDEREHRIETEVETDISGEHLQVQSPASQLRQSLGLTMPMRHSAPFEALSRGYDLWLLPHLVLKFAEHPLEQFRDGVPEGFTATDASSITIDDRPMVHLELKSGDGESDDADATFDLYIDPDSMLVERLRGQQRLPDGGSFETTVEIRPTAVDGDVPGSSSTDSVWSRPSQEATDAPDPEDSPREPIPSPMPNPSGGTDPTPSAEPDTDPSPMPMPSPQPAPEPRDNPSPSSPSGQAGASSARPPAALSPFAG